MEKTEKNILKLHSNHFFKEFTFGKNKFIGHSKGQQLEFADNVVWIDQFFLIFQIKDRNIEQEINFENWFKSKILRKAVQQIKNTISYLNEFTEILIENERGVLHDIAKAKGQNPLKLIVYNLGHIFEDTLRNQKSYFSSKIGHIHLLHIEDYNLICEILITPYEIQEYLIFREQLIKTNGKSLNSLTEEYILKHYLIDHTNTDINLEYNRKKIDIIFDIDVFDISSMIQDFNKKVLLTSGKNDYYYIIKELAKLHRSDLKHFKERFSLAINKCRDQQFDIPYRMTASESKCGFVFIPLEFERKQNAKNALSNFTNIHMYDQHLDKGIGMLSYFNPIEKYFDIFWMYIDQEWVEDKDYEKIIYKDFPLRKVTSEIDYRYYLKAEQETSGNK